MSFYVGWTYRPTGLQGRGTELVDVDINKFNSYTGSYSGYTGTYSSYTQPPAADYFYFEVYPKDVKEFDANTAKLNAEREKKK
jgi:hypothetical protein